MAKRARSKSPAKAAGPSPVNETKRPRTITTTFNPNKIATVENSAVVDVDPPLQRLLTAVENTVKNPAKGECVVYWMRMADLRIEDNRALALASAQAVKDDIPLVGLFVISPQDYAAHDRSPRRIDFTLRNLRLVKSALADLHIPLHTVTHTPRRTLPNFVVSLLDSLKAKQLYANIEYEVDELRRDIRICELAKLQGIKPVFVHDKCIIEPNVIKTKQEKVYTVYSPYQRNWIGHLNARIAQYIGPSPLPQANSITVHQTTVYQALFKTPVPDSVEGFELSDADQTTMAEVWPAGTAAAKEALSLFLTAKSRASQLGAVSPLKPVDASIEPVSTPFTIANGTASSSQPSAPKGKGKAPGTDGATTTSKTSRMFNYNDERDRGDADTTSRMSPYLSAGVISVRECVRGAMGIRGVPDDAGKIGTAGGPGRWVMELAWRDFYINVLVGFPRVSMGRPFNEKFNDVKWEVNEEHLRRWQEGKTGVPIVDAGMRQLNTMGWMHNRVRMITGMYLCKNLMIDWRLGEKYFMENLIDGDLSSNNGGWQWVASTGTDSVPYFRLFNPYSQSLKADPNGDYIRNFVPELRKLHGKDIHNPSEATADKCGYPRTIVKHEDARARALRRYKNPGEE
ncbi:hypothetical protein HWV62_3639 [Athelia sp. TMB]|nr:hypothetical protein HWV62_3639 [Athelia sp. TMB]